MKKYNVLVALMSLVAVLCAQEEPSTKLSFSGSADVYYRVNLNGPNSLMDDDDASSLVAPATSFANLPGFALGMFNLIGAYETEKVGVVGDLVFGPRGEDAVFGSPTLRPEGNSVAVNQLYVYWNVSDKVTFTLGDFNTFWGYEVISPTSDFDYSTSYLFSYGPFSHSGLKMDVDLGGGWSAMGAIMNPSDATEYNPDGNYVGGAQLGYSDDKGSIYLNSLFDFDIFGIDLTAETMVTDELHLGVNAAYVEENFYGFAGYAQYTFNDVSTFGIRGEYFADNGVGAIGTDAIGTDEDVVAFTFSYNHHVGDLTIIPEFRTDFTSNDSFFDNDLNPSDNLASFILAAVYAF